MVPELAAAKVLEGFDAAGKPRLRAPKRPITLRHLLTHTAGFGYEIWDPAIARYQTATGTPGITTCTNAALTRSEEHTSELQSQSNLVCRLLLEKKKNDTIICTPL